MLFVSHYQPKKLTVWIMVICILLDIEFLGFNGPVSTKFKSQFNLFIGTLTAFFYLMTFAFHDGCFKPKNMVFDELGYGNNAMMSTTNSPAISI